MQTKLMKMEYFDLKAETRLETYADTAVIEKEGNASYNANHPAATRHPSKGIPFGEGNCKFYLPRLMKSNLLG